MCECMKNKHPIINEGGDVYVKLYNYRIIL